VPNRYFGVFQDGEIKYRGIELRRHDTPPWVAKTQLAVLQCLAQAKTLEQVQDYISKALKIVEQAKHDLKTGHVPVEELLVAQRISRELNAYKTPSPAARAAMQLAETNKTLAPGQIMKFVFTRGRPGVWAYGCGEFDQRTLDVEKYIELLEKAIATILDSFTLESFRQNDHKKIVLKLPIGRQVQWRVFLNGFAQK
jgi:DNA polymerase-2